MKSIISFHWNKYWCLTLELTKLFYLKSPKFLRDKVINSRQFKKTAFFIFFFKVLRFVPECIRHRVWKQSHTVAPREEEIRLPVILPPRGPLITWNYKIRKSTQFTNSHLRQHVFWWRIQAEKPASLTSRRVAWELNNCCWDILSLHLSWLLPFLFLLAFPFSGLFFFFFLRKNTTKHRGVRKNKKRDGFFSSMTALLWLLEQKAY